MDGNKTIVLEVNTAIQPVITMTDVANVQPPYVHFRRRSEEWILYFILEGNLYLCEGEKEYELSEGHYLFLRPGVVHRGLRSSACRFAYIHFRDNGILKGGENTEDGRIDEKTDRKIDERILFHQEGFFDTSEFGAYIRSSLVKLQEYYHLGMPYTFLASTILANLLGTLAINNIHRKREKAVEVGKGVCDPEMIKQYLKVNFGKHITGQHLEEVFHANFDYMNRLFKKRTGQTIFDYLSFWRIEQAKKFLLTGLYTCNEVAAKTGFSDGYYFSKVFKKITGMPPGEFRRKRGNYSSNK